MRHRIRKYIDTWKARGYPEDIPDEVPLVLQSLQKAPSYKAICLAILTNDMAMKSLGFTPKPSPYYSELKRIEIAERNRQDEASV